MNKTTKILGFILACTILFFLGLFLNWLNERPVQGEQDFLVSVPNELELDSIADVQPMETLQQPPLHETEIATDIIDEIADMQRGGFINDQIKKSLTVSHMETISGVTLQVSDVVLYDTRAFVKVCMSSEHETDPLDFGSTHLISGEQEWINFYVNESDLDSPEEMGRCLILEFWGIPIIKTETIQFIMDYVGLVVPDEGKMCETYYRRVLSNDLPKQYGVEISCEEKNGMTDIQIIRNENQMHENFIYGIMNDVIAGITYGPWNFDLRHIKQD